MASGTILKPKTTRKDLGFTFDQIQQVKFHNFMPSGTNIIGIDFVTGSDTYYRLCLDTVSGTGKGLFFEKNVNGTTTRIWTKT